MDKFIGVAAYIVLCTLLALSAYIADWWIGGGP